MMQEMVKTNPLTKDIHLVVQANLIAPASIAKKQLKS